MKSAKSSGKLRKLKLILGLRRVSGNSMLPSFKPGSIVIVSSAATVIPGRVVIVSHHGLEKMKRVSKIGSKGVYLLGDNSNDSSDSRKYGWLSSTTILATVIWPRR